MRFSIILAILIASAAPAFAHFNVILPEDYSQWSGRKGAEVTFQFVWGHGYEHIWFDAQKPAALDVHPPDSSPVSLLPALQKKTVTGAEGKEAAAYRFDYKPTERGDHILALTAALLWDDAEEVFLQDYAKSVFHVQEKKGWDRIIDQPFELVPLNRPYALQEGDVIRAKVLYRGEPLANCEVEFEKLQPRVLSESGLPGEEFITFEAMTDPNGIVAFGLHEVGWFALTAIHETGRTIQQDGHEGPLVERSTLWIQVAPKPETH